MAMSAKAEAANNIHCIFTPPSRCHVAPQHRCRSEVLDDLSNMSSRYFRYAKDIERVAGAGSHEESEPESRARASAGAEIDQLAARAVATSVMTSGSATGWAWISPEIWPPHSISIWP